ncbi:MAG: EAL domain-containing protein [Sandaracinaceae bacterium]|nr:EAL domain-containing protein [Sandaracinaceae bacterium]
MSSLPPTTQIAFFDHFAEKGRQPRRIPILRFPFRVGRSQEAELSIYSPEVSSFHAELVRAGDRFLLRDLGSTNGTFVNGDRIDQHWLRDGDIVHIASEEMRFGLAEVTPEEERTIASPEERQTQLIRETTDLQRMLALRAVRAVFQPIVRLNDAGRIAYESLGRPSLEGRNYNVGQVFKIAAERGEGARMSRIMREVALGELRRIPEREIAIFFNLHPSEMTERDELLPMLDMVCASLQPGQRAVFEIHESAVTDPKAMQHICDALRERKIGLAYDDFGAGQSRLMELVEVPPDYIKLDMALVRDIDRSPKRQELVRALVSVMRDLGIEVLAEGIEREEEAHACRALGCELGQGYFYGRPVPAGG